MTENNNPVNTENNGQQANQQYQGNPQPQQEKTYIYNEPPIQQTPPPVYAPYPAKPLPDPNTVTILDWILSIIVMGIPCVNVIMLFVWAFSGKKESKKNFYKANLILCAASVLASIAFVAVMIAVLGPKIPNMMQQIKDLLQQFGVNLPLGR
jgi:hypothetical protein